MDLERNIMEDIYEKIKASELKRIADALEEVLRLVKEDQERSRARFEEEWDKKDE